MFELFVVGVFVGDVEFVILLVMFCCFFGGVLIEFDGYICRVLVCGVCKVIVKVMKDFLDIKVFVMVFFICDVILMMDFVVWLCVDCRFKGLCVFLLIIWCKVVCLVMGCILVVNVCWDDVVD